jgi:hypothetical protein
MEREALGLEEVKAALEGRPLPELPEPTPPQEYKPDSAEPDDGKDKSSKDDAVPPRFPVAEAT